MADDQLDDQAENWQDVGAQIASGAFPDLSADAISDVVANGTAKAGAAFLKFALDNLEKVAGGIGKGLVDVEEPLLPLFAAFLAPIVASMFNTDAGADLFASRNNRQNRGDASGALVDGFIAAITGGATGEQQPSDEGAKRLAGAGVHAALEGWFNAWILEMLSDFLPFDIAHFRDVALLPDEIIRTLGISRLVRRALTPLVNATAVQPMTWKANKEYRPTLLSEADAIAMFNRGGFSDDELAEELSRHGYSDVRQTALRLQHAKYLSVADAIALVRIKSLDRGNVVGALRNQGYDEATAELSVQAEEEKRREAIADTAISAIRRAAVDRRIDDAQLGDLMGQIVFDDTDRAYQMTAIRTERDLNFRFLSATQAEECVLADVLPIAAYRDALTREGYEPESALALELLLETKKNKQLDVVSARKQKQDDAAAAKADAQKRAADRQAQLDEQRRLRAEGPLGEWKRAVVTGLVPLARYAALLAERYDGDTVSALSALADQERAAYVAQQQKAADARKRAAEKGLNIGQLEQAVYTGVLTVDEFRNALSAQPLDAADADLLTAVVRAKLADLQAAQQKRADAAKRAKGKSIDLAKFEQLVRAGHRTIADYTALLRSFGYDDASIAALVDLLQTHIAADQAAAQQRAAIAAKRDAVSLSFDQIRRAVLLGVATLDQFGKFLVDHKFTPDAQAVLVAELRDDVAQADAARARRAQADQRASGDARFLPIARHAARLGVLTPAAYQARLVAAGYSADDVAIEMDLLVQEIAGTRAKATAAGVVTAKHPDRALTLSEAATAVKKGELPIDAYRARAFALGFDQADVDTLVAVLADELDAAKIAADLAGDVGAGAPPA
jgi:hypothetical protein